MISRLRMTFVLVSLIALLSCEQDPFKPPVVTEKPPPEPDSLERPPGWIPHQAKEPKGLVRHAGLKCQEAAGQCARLAQGANSDLLLRCVPKEVLEMGGGKDEMLAAVRELFDMMAESGATIEKVSVPDPCVMKVGEKNTFAIARQLMVVKMPSKTVQAEAFLIGVSRDQGASWKFMEGRNMGRPTLEELFPDFPKDLELPEVQAPTPVVGGGN